MRGAPDDGIRSGRASGGAHGWFPCLRGVLSGQDKHGHDNSVGSVNHVWTSSSPYDV